MVRPTNLPSYTRSENQLACSRWVLTKEMQCQIRAVHHGIQADVDDELVRLRRHPWQIGEEARGWLIEVHPIHYARVAKDEIQPVPLVPGLRKDLCLRSIVCHVGGDKDGAIGVKVR